MTSLPLLPNVVTTCSVWEASQEEAWEELSASTGTRVPGWKSWTRFRVYLSTETLLFPCRRSILKHGVSNLLLCLATGAAGRLGSLALAFTEQRPGVWCAAGCCDDADTTGGCSWPKQPPGPGGHEWSPTVSNYYTWATVTSKWNELMHELEWKAMRLWKADFRLAGSEALQWEREHCAVVACTWMLMFLPCLHPLLRCAGDLLCHTQKTLTLQSY